MRMKRLRMNGMHGWCRFFLVNLYKRDFFRMISIFKGLLLEASLAFC